MAFYTGMLGFRLTHRLGGRWAALEAGPSVWTADGVDAGLIVGLQPAAPGRPAPGTRGAVMFGVERCPRSSASRLAAPARSANGEGNPIYLWQPPEEDVPGDESGDGDDRMISGGHAVVDVAPRRPSGAR